MIREILLTESIEGTYSIYTVSLFIDGANNLLDEDRQKLKKLMEENGFQYYEQAEGDLINVTKECKYRDEASKLLSWIEAITYPMVENYKKEFRKEYSR